VLLEDVSYNEEIVVNIIVKAPDVPGRYILQYDMVHEGVTWFSEKGVVPLEVNIDVGKVIDKSITTRTYIIVSNGNGIAGSAGKIRDYLKSYGFKILGLSNADGYNYEKTVIYYIKDNKEKADQVAIVFSSYEMEEVPLGTFEKTYGKDTDIVVIVGKDYMENLE